MDILQPGQSIGPYRILNQIGQGGMATVYKAYHAAMNRYVAIKVLPRQLAENPEFIGRFRQEAQIIANLEHPHILPVHDFGEGDGFTYLVMRLLDGGTLKDRMQEHALSFYEIDRFLSQLADALEYAHTKGVVHRDIKPSNVLVDARDNLFLTDFGIAKLLESSSHFTGSSALIGTPDYMSPEQAQGLPVDRRSDIYSLGIILYEMVTGRVPFEAETPLAVVLKHINAALPLPTSLKPDLSPAIERVLLKALAKSPDDRFHSTAEFYTAWKQALEEGTGQPQQAAGAGQAAQAGQTTAQGAVEAGRAPVIPQRTAPAPRKKSRRWIIAAAILGVLLFVGAASLLAVFALPKIPGRVTARTQVATTGDISETPGMAATDSPGSGQVPGGSKAQWTSWTGANHVWAVTVRGDQIYAGGHGLAIWRLTDRSLAGHLKGPADGMPDVFINALLVDDDGNLWTGTYNGVGRYDGSQWILYRDEDGLDSTSIGALAWTGEGLLAGTNYCGSDGCGLNLLTRDGFRPFKGFPSAAGEDPGKLSYNVNALLPTAGGGLWAGTTNGLAHYDGKEWKTYFVSDGLPDNAINALMFDKDGVLWAGTGQGAAKFDGERFQAVETLNGTTVRGIAQDSQGSYWFSGDGGIARFNPASADWQIYTQADGLPAYSYYQVTQDSAGNLYFGSDNGLVRYDGKAFSTWALPNVPAFGHFGRILPGPEESTLWFIEHNNGTVVDSFNWKTGTWSPVNDLPEGCSPMAIDANKAVWCGGYNGLWVTGANREQVHLTVEQDLPSNQIVGVALSARERDTAWIGTADSGIAVFDGENIIQRYTAQDDGLTSDAVLSMLAASDGSLWVGTDKGLDRLTPDEDWEHFPIGSPFTDGLSGVTDIAEDASGAIWVGGAGEGNLVRRFAEGQWKRFGEGDPGVSLPGDFIQSITVGPDGSLWFGSYYHGAARFDGNTWTVFRVQDGLLHPNINDIFVQPDGAVWFATEGGATRFIP